MVMVINAPLSTRDSCQSNFIAGCRNFISVRQTVLMGPCHHCMARPQVADGGTASDIEASCE